MKPLLIVQNCEKESAGTILNYLAERKLPYLVVHSYLNHDLPDISSVDAIINLGCPHSVMRYQELDYLKKLYQFVSEAVRSDKPYLGLCFGGQILAKVLGARVERNPVMEIGTYEIRLTDAGFKSDLFKGFDKSFSVFHWHGDTFKIPFGAENLAETKDCKNQAFQKGNAVGLQFHLEADINEIPIWCDEYDDELRDFGKTREEIIQDYQRVSDKTKELNYLFLDKFLNLI